MGTMAVEDAVTAALLVTLSATLVLLTARAFRRYRNRSFLLLAGGFAAIMAEGILISLLALEFASPGGLWLSVIAGAQVVALVLVYTATFPHG